MNITPTTHNISRKDQFNRKSRARIMDYIMSERDNPLNFCKMYFANYPRHFTKYTHATQPKLEKLNEFCKTEGEKGELTRVYLPHESPKRDHP